MDVWHFVQRVVVAAVRLVMLAARAVWSACSGVVALVFPKPYPVVRIVLTAVLFIGAVVLLRRLFLAGQSH